MRTGFTSLVNPATSIKEHRGTPTTHARNLAKAVTEARNPEELAQAIDLADDYADLTTYVPDQRYLDRILSENQ